MSGWGGKRAWFLVTDQRLVFADKDQVGSKEHWSVPLERVESAVAAGHQGFGMHKFTVYYVDEKGKRQKKEFEHVNVTSGVLLGPLSKMGPNPLLPLEQTIRDVLVARQAAAAGYDPYWQSQPGPIDAQVSLASELERLASLREQGVLNEKEFQSAKKRLLKS